LKPPYQIVPGSLANTHEVPAARCSCGWVRVVDDSALARAAAAAHEALHRYRQRIAPKGPAARPGPALPPSRPLQRRSPGRTTAATLPLGSRRGGWHIHAARGTPTGQKQAGASPQIKLTTRPAVLPFQRGDSLRPHLPQAPPHPRGAAARAALPALVSPGESLAGDGSDRPADPWRGVRAHRGRWPRRCSLPRASPAHDG
jgi:hypothetical protein